MKCVGVSFIGLCNQHYTGAPNTFYSSLVTFFHGTASGFDVASVLYVFLSCSYYSGICEWVVLHPRNFSGLNDNS